MRFVDEIFQRNSLYIFRPFQEHAVAKMYNYRPSGKNLTY